VLRTIPACRCVFMQRCVSECDVSVHVRVDVNVYV